MEGGEYLDTKGVAREVYRFTAPNLQRPPWVSMGHACFKLRRLV